MTPSAADRLVRALLWLYPPAFRRRHGDEIVQFVRTAARDGAAPTAVALLADALGGAVREWRDALPLSRQTGEPMRTLMGDLRHAARMLAKSPGFTAAAVLTLALGIGANTAVFTLADTTLLRPVQVQNAREFVVWSWSSSYPDFVQYQKRTDIFQGVVAFSSASRINLSADGASELVRGSFISGNAFDVLGIGVAAGRPLLPSDDVANGPLVVVLGHDYWRSRFGADPSVVGKSIRINNRPATVVGIAEKGFRGPTLAANPAVYFPTAMFSQVQTGFFSRAKALETRALSWLSVIGRLQPGVSVEQATDAMDAMYAQLQGPPPPGRTREALRLTPLPTTALGGGAADVRRFVTLLVGVAGITLLIGCANLANLLLARAATRRREMGVRLALGATRGRVVQQMLTESVLLAIAGGGAGIAVAALALRLLSQYELPGGLAIGNAGLEIDRAALTLAFLLSMLTGILFGAVPAWRAARTDALVSLRDSGRAATARSGVRSLLLASQVAMSLVLLVGAFLFGRSLSEALKRPLGLAPEGVVTASVNSALARKDAATTRNFYTAALERVQSLPQVEAAAWASTIPTRGAMSGSATIEGYTPAPDEDMHFYFSVVGADYFRTVGSRLVAGRSFRSADAANAPMVAIVNEAMAKKYWSGQAVGGRLRPFGASTTIVGVVENTATSELKAEPAPTVYLAFNQWLSGPESITSDPAHLFVRTRGDAEALLPIVREQLRAIDPDVPLYDIERLDERLRMVLMPQRMGATLFAAFSALALTLAVVGIYGVASYVASLRTREIGVRIALGATGASVRRLILRQGLTPVLVGLVAGLALALYASRFAEAFLYKVTRFDPLTFIGVPVVLGTVALLATYVPARRASRIAPVDALRDE